MRMHGAWCVNIARQWHVQSGIFITNLNLLPTFRHRNLWFFIVPTFRHMVFHIFYSFSYISAEIGLDIRRIGVQM